MSYNKVTLIGNLGKDPDIKSFENGERVANFSIATSESYKDKIGERQTITDWHNIAVYGKAVDIIEKYVKKGSRLLVEGKLKTRSWEKDGQKNYVTEVVLGKFDGKILLMDSRSSNGKDTDVTTNDQSNEDDDLPF